MELVLAVIIRAKYAMQLGPRLVFLALMGGILIMDIVLNAIRHVSLVMELGLGNVPLVELQIILLVERLAILHVKVLW